MVNIILYTLSTCPWCKKAKRFFADNHIDVTCVDYDLASVADQQRIEEEIKAHSGGHMSFPYAAFGDVVVMGYNPERYRELLGIKEPESDG